MEIENTCTEDLSMTPNGKRVVLENVPAMSELIVTASKEGFRPSVYAVTTGSELVQDTTIGITEGDFRKMQLRSADSRWTRVGETAVSPEAGDLSFFVFVYRPPSSSLLADARVAPRNAEDGSPASGNGPFYWRGGKLIPGASATVSGVFPLPGEPFTTMAGTSFVNLDEGEYAVVVDHPDQPKCRTSGNYNGDVYVGYGSHLNKIRAPVLRGHSTAWIEATCFCSAELSLPGAGVLRWAPMAETPEVRDGRPPTLESFAITRRRPGDRF